MNLYHDEMREPDLVDPLWEYPELLAVVAEEPEQRSQKDEQLTAMAEAFRNVMLWITEGFSDGPRVRGLSTKDVNTSEATEAFRRAQFRTGARALVLLALIDSKADWVTDAGLRQFAEWAELGESPLASAVKERSQKK